MNLNGSWHIDYYEGTIEYDDTYYSITATSVNSDGRTDQAVGSYQYSIYNTESLDLGQIRLIETNGIIQLENGLLSRKGNSYYGFVQTVDGGPTTSWADYLDWYVEIIDTNDGDGDGIPDFTDPVEPLLFTVGKDLGQGWRSLDWFGVYFSYSSGWNFHVDHKWIYSKSGSLDSFWFWHQIYKWCWTNQTAYPWVWFHDDQAWKYYIKQTGQWVGPVASTE